jgi:Yip1 domain
MEGQIEGTQANLTADWISPWFTICSSPRATIRKIVDTDPKHFVIGIAWVAGALAALDLEMQFNGGSTPSLPQFVTDWFSAMGPFALAGLAFTLGVLGVGMLFVLGYLYRWSGGLLGGTATAVEVRAALGWTQVAGIYVTVLGVIVALLSPQSVDVQAGTLQPIWWWSIVRLLLGLWVFTISVKTIGEVHRFSAWRATMAMMLGNFAIGIVLALGFLAVMIGRGLA